MSTILENVSDTEYGYGKRIHMKGAAEILLEECTHYLNYDGERIRLEDGMKQNLGKQIEIYAEQALRTICLVYKDIKQGDGGPTHE